MTRIQIRRDTSERFNTINPILAEGEPAYETDTKKRKIGDGTTQYSELPYLDSGGGGGTEYTLPVATADTLGGIKQGTGCTIEEDGTLNITATGGEGGTTDYNELTNKPSINDVPLEGNLTTEQLGINIPDVSNLVTDEELATATQNLVTNSSLETTLTDYAKTSELPDVSNLVTNTDLTSTLEGYAKTSDIPDTSNFAKLDSANEFAGAQTINNNVTIKPDTYHGLDITKDNSTFYGGVRVSNSRDGSSGMARLTVRDENAQNYTDILGGGITLTDTEGQGTTLTTSFSGRGLYIEGSDVIADLREDAIEFTAPVKVGIKGKPQNLYVQSERQISRATQDGGLFYTVESKFNGTKIESLTQDAYDALEAPDENTIYMIEGGSQIEYVIDTYVNGNSGYRVWSDGYCEQWGERVGDDTFNLPVTFVKKFSSPPLVVTTINSGVPYVSQSNSTSINGITVRAGVVNSITETGFIFCHLGKPNGVSAVGSGQWKACGYLAEGEY